MKIIGKIFNPKKSLPLRMSQMFIEFFLNSSPRIGFVVGGVQKGGTSALDTYLRDHSQVCMASRKEVHFFDNELVQKLPSRLRYAYYHSFFYPCGSDGLRGESTPIYIWWPNSLERIKKYNPKIKLIFVLRDPVSRAYSHWNMERQRGLEKDSFSTCIRREDAVGDCSRVSSYVSRGFYFEQVKRVRKIFPEDQVLFLRHEDLLGAPSSTLNKITEFLGVSSLSVVEEKRVHSRQYESPLNDDDEVFLRNLFLRDVERLECELGWDLSCWK